MELNAAGNWTLRARVESLCFIGCKLCMLILLMKNKISKKEKKRHSRTEQDNNLKLYLKKKKKIAKGELKGQGMFIADSDVS